MRLLEERIASDGIVIGRDILKVDNFLNHSMDPELFYEMAKEWQRLFKEERIDKILTIEASGIGIACIAGLVMHVPVVFAKKSKSKNTPEECYTAKVVSFTRGITADVTVSKKYLTPADHVLIVDDFLATGEACLGLIDIVRQSGAELTGIAIAIEKSYQGGGDLLRDQGIHVESLARIASMDEENGIDFIR